MKTVIARIALAAVVIVGIVVGSLHGGRTKATVSNSPAAPVEFEAEGIAVGLSVLEERRRESCPTGIPAPLCNQQLYTASAGDIVVFRADDARTILIPMRTQAVGAAIPISTEARDVAEELPCHVGVLVCTKTKITHLPAYVRRGILRYHSCGDDLYCFESWEEVK